MSKLRILITNNTLAIRGGTELYVRDLATALLARGHAPIVYSTVLGEVADELRAATIPVIDNFESLSAPPDIIHAQHHLEAMTALLSLPGTPAMYICHGWMPWEEAPPHHPRIRQYVAVDLTCRDRLVYEHAIPEKRIRVLFNFVDLDRFKPRGPLPPRPQRALLFNNSAHEYTAAVREACEQAGIALDVIGLSAGTASARPEEVLGKYDLIFARGRSALEALAVGAAVVLCGERGAGPMVTTAELDRLRPLNFGIRTLRNRVTCETLMREIARYDTADAAAVSARIRAEAGRDPVVDQLIELYHHVIAEHAAAGTSDPQIEAGAAAEYLRWLSPRVKERDRLRAERDNLMAERAEFCADREWLKRELSSATRHPLIFRLRDRLRQSPQLVALYRTLLRK